MDLVGPKLMATVLRDSVILGYQWLIDLQEYFWETGFPIAPFAKGIVSFPLRAPLLDRGYGVYFWYWLD